MEIIVARRDFCIRCMRAGGSATSRISSAPLASVIGWIGQDGCPTPASPSEAATQMQANAATGYLTEQAGAVQALRDLDRHYQTGLLGDCRTVTWHCIALLVFFPGG